MISRVRPVGTPPRAGQLVVYYSRADLSRRRLPFANEALVLSTIRERMRAHARAETLVTFTGRGETFADQFRTFSRASVVVGAHGGGMMNVVWMQPSSAVVPLNCSSLALGQTVTGKLFVVLSTVG